MSTTIIIGILVTVCILLAYCTINLLKKVEHYETVVNTAIEDLDNYDRFFASAYEKIEEALNRLETIDRQNIFEKDDDVGIVFTAIKNVFNSLTLFLKKYGPKDEEKTKKV